MTEEKFVGTPDDWFQRFSIEFPQELRYLLSSNNEFGMVSVSDEEKHTFLNCFDWKWLFEQHKTKKNSGTSFALRIEGLHQFATSSRITYLENLDDSKIKHNTCDEPLTNTAIKRVREWSYILQIATRCITKATNNKDFKDIDGCLTVAVPEETCIERMQAPLSVVKYWESRAATLLDLDLQTKHVIIQEVVKNLSKSKSLKVKNICCKWANLQTQLKTSKRNASQNSKYLQVLRSPFSVIADCTPISTKKCVNSTKNMANLLCVVPSLLNTIKMLVSYSIKVKSKSSIICRTKSSSPPTPPNIQKDSDTSENRDLFVSGIAMKEENLQSQLQPLIRRIGCSLVARVSWHISAVAIVRKWKDTSTRIKLEEAIMVLLRWLEACNRIRNDDSTRDRSSISDGQKNSLNWADLDWDHPTGLLFAVKAALERLKELQRLHGEICRLHERLDFAPHRISEIGQGEAKYLDEHVRETNNHKEVEEFLTWIVGSLTKKRKTDTKNIQSEEDKSIYTNWRQGQSNPNIDEVALIDKTPLLELDIFTKDNFNLWHTLLEAIQERIANIDDSLDRVDSVLQNNDSFNEKIETVRYTVSLIDRNNTMINGSATSGIDDPFEASIMEGLSIMGSKKVRSKLSQRIALAQAHASGNK